VVSLSLIVMVLSLTVWKSTTTAKGIPSSSARAYLRPIGFEESSTL